MQSIWYHESSLWANVNNNNTVSGRLHYVRMRNDHLNQRLRTSNRLWISSFKIVNMQQDRERDICVLKNIFIWHCIQVLILTILRPTKNPCETIYFSSCWYTAFHLLRTFPSVWNPKRWIKNYLWAAQTSNSVASRRLHRFENRTTDVTWRLSIFSRLQICSWNTTHVFQGMAEYNSRC